MNTEKQKIQANVLINTREVMTPNDVAKKVGKSSMWIRYCIRSGQLKAINLDGRYFITPEQYEQWREENPNPKPGRPPEIERKKRKTMGGNA